MNFASGNSGYRAEILPLPGPRGGEPERGASGGQDQKQRSKPCHPFPFS